jgi:hypothetical protein
MLPRVETPGRVFCRVLVLPSERVLLFNLGAFCDQTIPGKFQADTSEPFPSISKDISGHSLSQRPAETVNPEATIREAVSRMIDKSVNLLVVTSTADGKPIGTVTLHDIIRFQNQLADAMV